MDAVEDAIGLGVSEVVGVEVLGGEEGFALMKVKGWETEPGDAGALEVVDGEPASG